MSAAPWIGVVAPQDESHTLELLGDAAELAGRLRGRVAVCTTCSDAGFHRTLIHHGADRVTVLDGGERGPNHQLAGGVAWWNTIQPRIAFAGADGNDRALACRLAVRCGARLISPALSATVRRSVIEITALKSDGRRARQIPLGEQETAIVTMRPGVAQARSADSSRTGEIDYLAVPAQSEAITIRERLPADPATADITHLPRLVAGGRGLGGCEGFELLRRVAARLDAGIAASRMAVDLGWIERERQVGQTGKTVKPELYLAIGISGASHHREGMSDSRHIIAINSDPQAPIFKIAHLGLAADWEATLRHVLDITEPKSNP